MEYQEERSLYAQRASRGEENLRYLKDRSNFLSDGEKKVLALIERRQNWGWQTDLMWLDYRRMMMDEDYAFIRKREGQISILSQQVKNIQQIQAIEQLKRVAETGVREPTQQQADNAIAYLKRKGKL